MPVSSPEGVVAVGCPSGLDVFDCLCRSDDGVAVVKGDKRIAVVAHAELIGAYAKLLASKGKSAAASRLMPGVRFLTSDTGVSSAKVSALLLGGQHPIHIGSCIALYFDRGGKPRASLYGEVRLASHIHRLLQAECPYTYADLDAEIDTEERKQKNAAPVSPTAFRRSTKNNEGSYQNGNTM